MAFVVALALLSVPAGAASRYVATNGNDLRGNGSLATPFATINKAASVARPGDTVFVRGGVYRQTVAVWTDGTEQARITFRPHGKERVIIDGGGRRADAVTIGGDYVDWIGFEIRNSGHIGLVCWGAHHVRLLGNTIHHCERGGIYVGHSEPYRAHDVVVAGNTVRDTVLENRRRTWEEGNWAAAIGVWDSRRVTVRQNRVFRNFGEGILLDTSKDCEVMANEVFDNFSVQIYLTYAQRSTVDGNRAYSTGNRAYYRNGRPADGIMLANEKQGKAAEATSGNSIVNNIVGRSRWGIAYWRRTPQGMKNTRIANNTISDAAEYLLYIDPDPAHGGNLVENNTFQRRRGSKTAMTSVPAGAATLRNNKWIELPGPAARGTL